ncbi:hypothetical protein BV25DRAFT_1922615 [Artomyces pyxidatus]|uniref:Uncharacterized protein n=1 Tax=Artomyces pyxidatus TaxID=48021 RepID=A0ACB8SE50_9AGAM|nr:hypothetical protein BV25DRAFT_1922615 [Artomyces pyxidatus]
MSFILARDGTHLVREKWGFPAATREFQMPDVIDDIPDDDMDADADADADSDDHHEPYSLPYQRCPIKFGELCSWGYFTHNEDADARVKKPFVFAHVPATLPVPPPKNGINEVELRIQGFVETRHLSRTGSWNGDPAAAAKAEQTLTLGPGRFSNVFNDQVTAIRSIGELGRVSLCPRNVNKGWNWMTRNGKIFFRRRVFGDYLRNFTQTSLDQCTNQKTVDGFVDKFVEIPLTKFCFRTDDGKIHNCTSKAIQVNDFVEVHAVVEVSLRNAASGVPRVQLTLRPTTIIKLGMTGRQAGEAAGSGAIV